MRILRAARTLSVLMLFSVATREARAAFEFNFEIPGLFTPHDVAVDDNGQIIVTHSYGLDVFDGAGAHISEIGSQCSPPVSSVG